MRRRLLSSSVRSTRRPGWRGGLRLAAVFSVLVGINVYVFFFRGGTSIGELLEAGSIKREGAEQPKAKAGAQRRARATAPVQPKLVVKGAMKGYVGLAPALAATKIDPSQVAAIIKALKGKLNLRALRPRHTFELHLDQRTRRLRRFAFHLSPIERVVVTRRRDGALRAKRVKQPLTVKQARIGGRIETSLNRAMVDAGEKTRLVARLVDLFAWDINWFTDPRKGDEFRLVVEKQYLDGEFYGYGKLLAAEYRGNVGRFRAFYFKRRDGDGGHYSPEGRSIRRAFLKTPLNYRRISSGFNRHRMHPILHRHKAHLGVDYAAPRGTPIWAAGAGVVTTARRRGAAGKMVALRHAGGIITVYMHLSRFARGLKEGQKVKQRQVIGFVGSTGRATGPHLHYGVKVGGRYIDPPKFAIKKGRLLPHSERHRFLDTLAARMEALERIPVRTAATAAADKGEEDKQAAF